MLKYAEGNVFPNPTFFIDDGVSGVTFGRPGWNEMIRLAEAGKVKTVIVSDKGDNDFTPFRNLFNDFYARDTVMRAKGTPENTSALIRPMGI